MTADLRVEPCDREAAWPHRYQGAYAENDMAAWMSGRYDKADIVQAFARHRLAERDLKRDAVAVDAVEADDSYIVIKCEGLSADQESAIRSWLAEQSVPALAALEARPQDGVEKRCEYCDDTGYVHSIDGEWRVVCHCPTGDQCRTARHTQGEQVK